MELLGLPFSQLLTLFGVVGAGVVALYILKLRRRRVAVPFTKLWERVLIDRPTSSLFQHLKRILSLLIQLLLLALLVGAVGDPRARGVRRAGRSMVVLIDGSASMKATDVPGTRAGAARVALRRIIREMGVSDQILIAQMDAEVTALSPMTDDPASLEAATRQYAPRDTGADLARALRFSLDSLRGADRPEVIVIGDGVYPPARDGSGDVSMGAVPLRFVPIGVRGRNVGIEAFSVRRYPLDKSRYEVLIEVRNFSTERESIDLTLNADGAPIEVTRLTLEPGGSVQRVLPNLSGANESLEAIIARADGTRDDLPADDHAWATLPARRRARVLAVTNGNRYLEAALLLDEYLDVSDAPITEAANRLRTEHFDVVVFDGATLPVPPGVGAIYLRPEGPDSPFEAEPGFATAPTGGALGFTQVDSHHPIMRWMSDLEGAHIGRIIRYRTRQGDRVLGQSAAGPLLIVGERHGDRFVSLSFDPRESDLPLLVSWPIMLINSIDWFSGEDPAYLSSFRTGDTWRVPVVAGAERATYDAPGAAAAQTAPVMEGRAVIFGAVAGLYRVHAGGESTLVAGNLVDPMESQCAPRRTLEVNGVRGTAPVGGSAGVRREIWIYLLAGALAILVIEWATYHRRVTV